MKKIMTIITISSFLLMLILMDIAFAIPAMPNQFYGSLTYNGGPAQDGMRYQQR